MSEERRKFVCFNEFLVPNEKIREIGNKLCNKLMSADDVDTISTIDFIAMELLIKTREKLIHLAKKKEEKEKHCMMKCITKLFESPQGKIHKHYFDRIMELVKELAKDEKEALKLYLLLTTYMAYHAIFKWGYNDEVDFWAETYLRKIRKDGGVER